MEEPMVLLAPRHMYIIADLDNGTSVVIGRMWSLVVVRVGVVPQYSGAGDRRMHARNVVTYCL